MSWTAPMTAVAGATFTAAQFNQYVRDNLNETAPAKVSAAGQYLVGASSNSITARAAASSFVSTTETTTSTSYTDLTTVGPSVTVTTGTTALAFYASNIDNNTDNSASSASVAVSGASSVAASDNWRITRDGSPNTNIWRIGAAHLFTGLTAGSNIFTMKYLVGTGTGSFSLRELIVVPF